MGKILLWLVPPIYFYKEIKSWLSKRENLSEFLMTCLKPTNSLEIT